MRARWLRRRRSPAIQAALAAAPGHRTHLVLLVTTATGGSGLSGRTKSQIEADLGATRDRLAASVSGLIDEVHPVRIKQRTVGRIRAAVQARVDDAHAYFFNARGDLRTDHVVRLGSVAAGTLTVLLTFRALLRRRRR